MSRVLDVLLAGVLAWVSFQLGQKSMVDDFGDVTAKPIALQFEQDPSLLCGNNRSLGCTLVFEGVCIMVLPIVPLNEWSPYQEESLPWQPARNPTLEVIGHELLHCAGFDHVKV